MALRFRVECETWKRIKRVTRNRYWKRGAVWLHVKPLDPEMEKYKYDNACRNRGSLPGFVVDNAEQGQNGHAFQTSADISAGALDDWMTQERLRHEFDGAMRFPQHMRQTSKLSVFSCCMLLSVWSVYGTEWAHRNRPCSNKTLNVPSKHQEAMLVSKGCGSGVYLISSFAGWEDMVLALIVMFGLRNSALDRITEEVFA